MLAIETMNLSRSLKVKFKTRKTTGLQSVCAVILWFFSFAVLFFYK